MSNSVLPSNFASPFITTISSVRYDSRGRQMQFTESNVQRLERQAFVSANSNSGSPSSSPTSSGNSTPTRQLISEPFCDPIELMANRLAEELFGSDDFSSSSDEELFGLYAMPQDTYRVPSSSARSSSRRKSSSKSSSNHARRKSSSSLSAIPEED
ncbi:hypothetical protein CPB83DRAFT_896474 [Crepidotus variabilis]|uniref:Uncharacterized protein n=1 Tax=Crepidotus variabilis TaxID=179855 RepID=A0A9P6JMN7_9AGAR|nr:hypothetical protein CPB83DRAFT_896474 [Crepidotus variabilis]